MKWWGGILVAVILTVMVAAVIHWTFMNTQHGNVAEEDCSACHARSALQTHTRDFVESEHGPIALADRSSCEGCHEDTQEACDDCHLSQAPDWHTDDFRNPVLGPVETREHIRIAKFHEDTCSECHNSTYMARCVECHRPDENWLGRGDRPLKQDKAPDQQLEERP